MKLIRHARNSLAPGSGPGNLVSNLLCAVANLLNGVNLGNMLGTELVNTLTTLLNNLLAALQPGREGVLPVTSRGARSPRRRR